MIPALFLFLPAALFGGVAAWWVARAYAGAGGNAKPAIIGIGIGLVAVSTLYLAIGRPGLPDQPHGPRLTALMGKNPRDMTANELLAVLEARARTDSKDPRPLIFSGEILTQMRRPDLAVGQFQAALARGDKGVEAMIGLGRAQVAMDQGKVSAEALATFQRAQALAPDDPIPWLYQALGASQDERYPEAAALWTEVLKRLPPDDPRRQMAQQMIAEAKAKTTRRR